MAPIRKPIRDGKLIYHLTALDNWSSVAQSGLLSRNAIGQGSLSFTDVANPDLIYFRGQAQLNDYVPFHFFCKNPFDGDVQLSHPDEHFIYITVHRDTARVRGYQIIPRHPRNMAVGTSLLLPYDQGMAAIDWDLLEQRDYQNEACKQVCMAECLARDRVPVGDFFGVYASSEEAASLLRKHSPAGLKIDVNPSMFVRRSS